MIQALRNVCRLAFRAREEGQVLALFAAGIVGFCGLVGMSIDIGKVVFTGTDLQKIADASALAAAQDLPSTATALTTANSFGAQNGSATLTTEFADSNMTVKVTAQRKVDYTFLRVVGLQGMTVKRSATAHSTYQTITGYSWDVIAPFIIWGGSRERPVAADRNCPFQVCVGKAYSFLDNQWMRESGQPSVPDWTASDSNNFKGDIHHGQGNPVNHIGETFSEGGLGAVEPPPVGSLIVIPIVDRASGNSNERHFRIAAWAVVKVAPGCTKQGCKGIVQGTSVTPPKGWATGGNVQPPPELAYKGNTVTLTN